MDENNKKAEKKTQKKSGKSILKNEKMRLYIGIAVFLLLLFFGFYFLGRGIDIGVTSAKSSYQRNYDEEKKAAYDARYNTYYEKAKNKSLTENKATIHIDDIKTKADLEVLHVSDIEYVIESQKDNNENITSWLEVPGSGVFIVNLQVAEFIVNNANATVLVRAPYPELTHVTVDYANVKKLLFKNDLLNDSYKVGEDLARKQLAAGDLLIKKEFSSNEYFYKSAQNAAEKSIKQLVTQFNPKVQNLKVTVEFF